MRGCSGGACMVAHGGGMRGCSGGHVWLLMGGCAWLLMGGHAWLLMGGCEWLLTGGHAWLLMGGVHGCSWGACMVAHGGACVVAHGGACMVAHGGVCVFFFLDEVRSISGQYASYWNAFLYLQILILIVKCNPTFSCISLRISQKTQDSFQSMYTYLCIFPWYIQ